MPSFGDGSDPNAPGNVTGVVMTVLHPDFLGGYLIPVSATYDAANPKTASRIEYYPFVINRTVTITRGVFNVGATVAGNYDMGIYSESGTRLTAIGTTAVPAGANVYKFVDFADVTLTPGRYYLGIVFDTAGAMLVGRINSAIGASGGGSKAVMMGTLIQSATFPLPATATFAIPSASAEDAPALCGIVARSTP